MRPELLPLLLSCALSSACGGGQTPADPAAAGAAAAAGAESQERGDGKHGDGERDDGLDFDPKKLVRFELIADSASLSADQPTTLGALFHIAEGWHIYWINPGESGLPTKISLDEVEGVTASAPRFPGPVRFDSDGEIVNYGYNGTLVVPIALSLDSSGGRAESGQPLELRAKASWLACREDACVPGDGQASLSLPGQVTAAELTTHAQRIAAAQAMVPRSTSELGRVGANLQTTPLPSGVHVRLLGPAGGVLQVFPIEDAAVARVKSGTIEGRPYLHFDLHPQDGTSKLAVLSIRRGPDIHYFAINSELIATR